MDQVTAATVGRALSDAYPLIFAGVVCVIGAIARSRNNIADPFDSDQIWRDSFNGVSIYLIFVIAIGFWTKNYNSIENHYVLVILTMFYALLGQLRELRARWLTPIEN